MFVFNNDYVDCDTPVSSPPLFPPLSQKDDFYIGQSINSKILEIKINCDDALQIFILSFGVFTLLRLSPL